MVKKSKWLTLLKNLIQVPDTEWIFIDGSYVKAHQHSAGAQSVEPQAIGKSRAGNTTKIHLAVDSYGLPIEFTVTGQWTNHHGLNCVPQRQAPHQLLQTTAPSLKKTLARQSTQGLSSDSWCQTI